jgi:hypothetical protein
MIDPELIAAAKAEIAELKNQSALAQLSDEDRELMRKYPKHTLAAARLIDSTPAPRGLTGCRSAFYLIRLQETSNFHISADHT